MKLTELPISLTWGPGWVIRNPAFLFCLMTGDHYAEDTSQRSATAPTLIVLNQELDEFWARFVCAHELGHIILHPHVNTAFLLRSTLFSVDKIEKQANRFAIELLTVGSSCWCQQDDSMTVRECAARYGIPREFEELLAFYQ